MPIKEFKIDHKGKLVLWHILETKEELESLLSEAKRPDFIPNPPFHAPKRNLEWMAARLTLIHLEGPEADLIYDKNGKPGLKSGKGHISISHSLPYVAIYYNTSHSVGIDLEQLHPKIERIEKKFVNEAEERWLSGVNKLHGLYLIWAAKESVFKMMGGGGILFREHMELKPVTISSKGQATIIYKKEGMQEVQLQYEFLDNMILVYTIAPEAEI